MKNHDHFAALDGLRGFAALSVLLYHLAHWLVFPTLAANANFAVDLFFCLSGYVLPLAYGQAAAPTLSFARFVRLRLVRLMPLIVFATLLSGAYVLSRLAITHQTGYVGQSLVAIVLGSLCIPYFDAPAIIGGPQIFPLNGPQYTLFLELIVNVVWFATRKIDQLPLAIAVAAVCFVLICIFGYGGDVESTFWLGFPRVGASYFAGVALFHAAQHAPFSKIAAECGHLFPVLAFVMAGLFFFPYPASSFVSVVWTGIAAPLLVLSGAKYELPTSLKKICMYGGLLSYPIYALHYPVFCWINGGYQFVARAHVSLEIPATVAVVIGMSVLTLTYYDQPMRAMLSGRRSYRPEAGKIR